MARRILLTIEYDGTAYSGWQRQYNGLAVQQLIEEALTRATGEAVTITGASRTDAGVHALGQCAHFDTASRIPPEKYPFVLNTMLPRDIRVQAGREVPGRLPCALHDLRQALHLPHPEQPPWQRHPPEYVRACTHSAGCGRDASGFADTAWYARFRRVIRRPAARRRRPSEPSAWRR